MTFIIQIFIGIFILGILVLIHEFGHFIVAKKCGIRIISFSIGFGKPIYTKKIGNTEYRISSIPFGGYVHMAGEHPEDTQEQKDDEFMAKPVWQRACVAIAGPVANIIASIFFLWIVFIVGVQREIYLDNTNIGHVVKDSPAYMAGIVPGDSVIAINNQQVQTWEDISRVLSFREPEYEISVVRKGEIRTVEIELSQKEMGKVPKYPTAGLLPLCPARVGSVGEDSPAQKSGIQENDLILAIDNVPVHSWFQLSSIISVYNSSYGPMQFIVMRKDSVVIINAEPEYNKKEERYLLGIMLAQAKMRTVRYSPIYAVPKALEKSWEYTTMIFTVLKKLASQKVSPKQLAGPIGIIQMSGAVALGSIIALLKFMALIGINLGVLNLLPLVITDGGVLFFLLIEFFRGKPLSLKKQLMLNRIAIALFITLFVFVTFNDILRIPQIFNITRK